MAFNQSSLPDKGEQIAVIKTNMGTVKFKFFPQYAPETVKNFVELTKKGFYDGLIFHRVVPDFVIQGGDPSGNGTGGETYKGPGTMLNAEIAKEPKHIYGAVAMARKGNDLNSATSQFYIVQNKKGVLPLDGQYTIFGQVFEGMDIVEKIAQVEVDALDKPVTPVVMEKVTIEQN